MRPLTEDETKIVFQKLAHYIGEENYVFRLHGQRVYYLSETLLKIAINIGRDELCGIGTCFGKFTKSNKFRLHITSLDYLAKYSKYKIWLKPQGEQTFLYGNHVVKAHLARITENTPINVGVVIMNMNDIALGFGVSVKSTLQCRDLDPTSIVAINQADLGEYLRNEDPE